MKASQTLMFSVLMAGCSMPAFAQTATVPPTAQVAAPNLNAQVRTMERVFSSAIQNGVDQIALKINAAIPGLRIFAGLPHAHGYQVENFGWFFDVEVPEVQMASVDLYQALQQDPRRPAPNSPATAVGNTVRPAITERDDAAVPAVIRDPQREYDLAIRESLIDAMLDYGQLPLKANEELTVGARAADSPVPTMESSQTLTLILRITGADLALYKQGKITREEAKARIRIKEDRR